MDGLKYFIYQISRYNNHLPYIPIDLRRIIWNKCFPYPYLTCQICNKVLITLEINQLLVNQKLEYSIVKGYGNCLEHNNLT